MMTRKWLAIACVVLLAVSLAGCVTDSGYYDPARSAGAGALGGAATGAALGAIIGAATGNAATGAWVGAAAGGVLGRRGRGDLCRAPQQRDPLGRGCGPGE